MTSGAGDPLKKDGCIFCTVSRARIVAENEFCLAFRDKHPVAEHHTLVIPKRHIADFFDLEPEEYAAVLELLQQQRQIIKNLDETVAGFNVGTNAGVAAGQSILHCHIHLIPRRKGDTKDARGGVRNVIPERSTY